MATLEWIGKEAVLHHHKSARRRLLSISAGRVVRVTRCARGGHFSGLASHCREKMKLHLAISAAHFATVGLRSFMTNEVYHN